MRNGIDRKTRMNPYNIEGRPKEKPNQYVPPTRTLFVRDIAFETKIEEVEQIFKTFGEIKIAFDLIPRRGIAFITFFDLRDAERAKNTLTDLKFHGRPAEIHYSLPKEGDQSKNQASLDVEYEGPGLTEQELSDYMSKFGAVKSIKPDSSNSKFLVSFWDSRHSARAVSEIDSDGILNSGKIKARLGWDEGFEPLIRATKEKQGRRDDDRRDDMRDKYRKDNDRNQKHKRDRHESFSRDGRDNRDGGSLHSNSNSQMQPNMMNPAFNPMLMNPLFLAMMVQQQQLQQQQPQTHQGLPSNPPSQQQMNTAAQMQQQQLLAMLGQLGNNPGNQANTMQALQQQQATPQPNMPNFLSALQSTAPQQQPMGGLPDFNQIQQSQSSVNPVHDPRLALQSTATQQQAQVPTLPPEQTMPSQQPKAADQVPASSQGQLQALAAMLMQKSQK